MTLGYFHYANGKWPERKFYSRRRPLSLASSNGDISQNYDSQLAPLLRMTPIIKGDCAPTPFQ